MLVKESIVYVLVTQVDGYTNLVSIHGSRSAAESEAANLNDDSNPRWSERVQVWAQALES